ncbi:GIY-YIG nuclease family protein [Enterovibrio norvegicus]|uniref:GIY-YIG nuclease family protein n=1 Tax=Enterovibrio norvegicus TaxID=188144 RepID=UPI00389A33D8
MELFPFLRALDENLVPASVKLHMAVWNGRDNPLDVYLSGKFEEWQSWQTKRNFERKYIVSLIQLPNSRRWILAGVYKSLSSKKAEGSKYYRYTTSELTDFESITGRVIVDFKRTGRASYLKAENWHDKMTISEVLSEKMAVKDFTAYNSTSIDKSTLDIIVSQCITSWKTALSAVSGIYLITDKATGKLYVGSATDEEGFWQRWRSYSLSGHGGNKELKQLLIDQGDEYALNFQYSILEIADNHSSPNQILDRESYWKDVLSSRIHGYNSN